MVSVYSAPVLDSICLCVDTNGVCLFCTSVGQHLSVCLHKWFIVSEYFTPVLDSTECLCVHSGGSWCLSVLHQCWTASVCVFAQVVCGVCLFCTVSVGQHLSVCSLKWFVVSVCFVPVLDSIWFCVHSNGLWCLFYASVGQHLVVCSLKWFVVSVLHCQRWGASVCVLTQMVCGVCFVPVLDSICLCVNSNGLWCLFVLCQYWTASVCVLTQMACGVCFVPVLDSICLCVHSNGLWCLFCASVGQYLSVCSLIIWFVVSVCFVPVMDSICLCVYSDGLWCLSILHQCWTACVCVFAVETGVGDQEEFVKVFFLMHQWFMTSEELAQAFIDLYPWLPDCDRPVSQVPFSVCVCGSCFLQMSF